MSFILSDSKHYSNIADAIRYKNHKGIAYRSSEMADAVLALQREGSLSNDPNLKDVFNHGNIVGFNPTYVIPREDPTYYYNKSPGVLVGSYGYLKMFTDESTGKQYMRRACGGSNTQATDSLVVFNRFSLFNIQYSKICFDVEVVDGGTTKNLSSIKAMRYNTLTYSDHNMISLTSSSSRIYNLERQVVKLSVPTDTLRQYWIGFNNVNCTIKIYSIWLEP